MEKRKVREIEDEIIREIKRKNNSANKLSICSTLGGMQMSYNFLFDSSRNVVDKHRKGEGDGMRWVINIDKESVDLVKTCSLRIILSGHDLKNISYESNLKSNLKSIKGECDINNNSYSVSSDSRYAS
jgi:hypothetical protein